MDKRAVGYADARLITSLPAAAADWMFMARPEVGVVWILDFPLAGKFLSKLAGVEVSTKMDVQKNDILYYYSYVKKT